MSFKETCLGFVTKLTIVVLLISVVISLRYGSTNPQYLGVRLFHSLLTLRYELSVDRDRPTLSANYRAFEDVIRLKPVGPFDPAGDPVTVVKKLRLALTMKNLIPRSSECQIVEEEVRHQGHAVQTFWINHRGDQQRLIIYLHGGAYAFGDIHSYSGFECHLSRLFNSTFLHVEYRLSPEHRLPAAVQDVVSLYRSLLSRNVSPSEIFFMGDSAGGGLALLTIQSLINDGLPIPRAVIVLSPWTDLSASGESYTRNEHTDVLLSAERFEWLIEHIVHSRSSANSSIYSPLFGSFDGFPPMYINVGTAELLEDDSRRLVKKLLLANVSIQFEVGRHLMHVYPIFFPYFPEAQKTLSNIQRWIERTSSSS